MRPSFDSPAAAVVLVVAVYGAVHLLSEMITLADTNER